MASVVDDPNGRRRIQFVGPDGARRTLRLGKIDRRSAESIAQHVERLLASRMTGEPIPRTTAVWLADVGEQLRDRLARAGLIEAERRQTVEEYLVGWVERKKAAGHTPQSLIAWGHAIRDIKALFASRTLDSLTPQDGETFRGSMQARSLRATTIHKRLTHARQFLTDAVRLGLLERNPWQHVRHRMGDVSERRAYVPVADVERVIEHCPNVWWRLLVALARFAGLRTPSEPFSMTWGDVDWERGRLSVPSPKTVHQGKSHRVIPLFPMLRPYLEAAFEQAEPGSVYLMPNEYRQRAMGPAGWVNANLRTQLERVIRRAGVDPWPRLWHSLRASCESDLAQSFPLAVVTKWLGNTPSIALRHYVDPTEAAFEQAQTWRPADGKGDAKSDAILTQNPTPQILASTCVEVKGSPQTQEPQDVTQDPAASCEIVQMGSVERKRFEHIAQSCGNTHISSPADAKSDAVHHPPDLMTVIGAWEHLPEDVRQAIVALVEGARHVA